MKPSNSTKANYKVNDPVLGQELVTLSFWSWEQDEDYHFTQIKGAALGKAGSNSEDFIGLAHWDRGAMPISDRGDWDNHKATLKARKPFADFLFKRPDADGTLRYISSSGEPMFDDQGQFRGYHGIDKDVTALIQMELRRSIEHGVTQILAESNSITEAAPQIIRLICETLGWSCGARWVPDGEGEALRCAETWGVASAGINAFLKATRQQAPSTQIGGLNRRAWVKCEPLWIQDVTEDKTFRRGSDALKAGLHSAFAFPIKAGADSIGVLDFFSREMHLPDIELLNTTRYIGSQIGQFMQRKQAEDVVHENVARFRSLTSLFSDWFWEQDTEFRFTRMEGRHATGDNAAFNEELGKTHEEMGVEVEGGWEAHHALLAAHRPFRDVVMWRTFQDGKLRYMSVSGEPMFDAEGRFLGYRGVGEDITARKCEEQLQALEHAVTRSLADADTVPEVLEAAIRAVCEAQGWACGRCFQEDEAAGVLRFIGAWSASAELADRIIERSRNLTYLQGVGMIGTVWQTGQPIWCADSTQDPRVHTGIACDCGLHGTFVFPITSEGRSVGVLIFHSYEVWEEETGERLMRTLGVICSQVGQYVLRKQAEVEQRRFRAAMDASADLMLLIDPASHRYIDVNDTACRALGYAREELLATNSLDIFSRSGEELGQLYDQLLSGELSAPRVEGAYQCKDGSHLLIEASLRVVRSAGGEMIVSVARDIRERRRAEQLLALEHAINLHLSQADSVSEALKSIIRTVCESQEWECGRYFYVDIEAGLLRFGEAWSSPDPEIEAYIEASRAYTSPLDKGSKAGVWRTGEPRWSQEISRHGHLVQSTLGYARDSFVFAVTVGGQSLGVLSFTSREVREPDERLLQAVRVIGNQVGQFLQRKQAEEVLRESEERFRSLTELSSDWFWEQDAEFRFSRFEGRSGTGEGATFTGSDLIGKRPWETGAEIEGQGGWDAHRALLQSHCLFRDVVVMSPLPPGGQRRYFSLSGEPILDRVGHCSGYRGVMQEITERKLSEERIQYLATHDGLTDLPNRSMFNQIMQLAISSGQRYQRHFAVLFIDLDRFKIINDTLGHDAGDTLLQAIAGRIDKNLRTSDVVARLGGDEFVVLLQEVTRPEQAAIVARKLLSTVIKPVVILGQECRVTASIGISLYPADGEDEQTLMKNADMAMYLAKEQGKNNFQFYSRDIKTQSLERLSLENHLRHALERKEFFLHYQAKLDLHSGVINGVEALLRWQHPELGLVSPLQFISLAEETGLIVPIGLWVLRTACAQSVAWQKAGLAPVCMAVNLSPRQFTDDKLLNDLAEVLQESGLEPSLLELEITESMVMGSIERSDEQLAAIKRLGVRLAIDDFGTGYSSLAQIKRYPIDTIKVDRSFIRDIPQDAEDKAITKAIIAMGKSLSLTVVAEGVETEQQQDFLREHGCDEMQGFYFSKPVTPDQFAELLRDHVAVVSVKK